MDKSRRLFLITSQTNTLASRIIRLYTKAPYNHISIALDSGLEKMYSFGRKKPPYAFPSGFLQETMEKSLFGMMDFVPCQIYSLPVTEVQYVKAQRLIDEFDKIADKYKFNLLGFASMILKIKYRRKRHFMCSQFVAFVLQQSDIIDFGKDYSLVTPEDIRTRNDLTLVFEGNLKQYINEKIYA